MPVQSSADGGATFSYVFVSIIVFLLLLLTGVFTIVGFIACPLLIAWLVFGNEFFNCDMLQPDAIVDERRRMWRLIAEEDAGDNGGRGGGKEGDEVRRQRPDDDSRPQTCRRRRVVLTLRYIGDLTGAPTTMTTSAPASEAADEGSFASPEVESTDEPESRTANELDDVNSGLTAIVDSSQRLSVKRESAVADSIPDASVAVTSNQLASFSATVKSTVKACRSDRQRWQLRRSVERMIEASCLMTSYVTSAMLLQWLPLNGRFDLPLSIPHASFRKLLVKEDFDDVSDNGAEAGQTAVRRTAHDDDENNRQCRIPKLSITVESEVNRTNDGTESDFCNEAESNKDDDEAAATQSINSLTSKAVHHHQHQQQQQQPQQQQPGIVLRRPASHW
jgi:hypothetical protein